MKDRLTTRFQIDRITDAGINSRWFFAGSCFAENMGDTLQRLGFNTFLNPFGILYNPHSIATSLEKIATEYQYSVHDLYFTSGDFVSLDHHGSFRDASAELLARRINETNEHAFRAIENADYAVITLGTAWVWVFRDPQKIAGNCHRIASHEFTRRLLTEQEIRNELFKCVQYLRMIQPDIRVLFTVSPVKHLREGIVQNNISKSRLISSLASFLEQHPECHYFPAYEVVTEELRDHRFYAEDLAHPSNWTIRYIFQRFAETCLNEQANAYLAKAIQYLKMTQHRMLSPDPDAAAAWQAKLNQQLTQLKSEFPEKTDWQHWT